MINGEFQIEIDDIYACPGSCTGCVLSINERKLVEPAMPEAVMDLTLRRLTDYVPTLQNLESVNVAYGIADHLLLSDDYIVGIYRKAEDFLKKVGFAAPGKGSVFFSTSLIGKAERVIERLKSIADRVADGSVPFYPIAVFNPVLMETKFGDNYGSIITSARTIFGRTDLAVNMSGTVVDTISPRDMVDFAKDRGFDEVTINWTPTLGNVSATCMDLNVLVVWLKKFADIADAEGVHYSFGPVIRRSINSIMCERTTPDESAGVVSVIKRGAVRRTLERSIQFDHNGYYFPKLEAVGDVAHNSRFGYVPLGNVVDGELKDILDASWAKVERAIVQAHTKTSECMTCNVSDVCAMTGFHVYNRVLDMGAVKAPTERCRHIARDLIEHFSKRVAA